MVERIDLNALFLAPKINQRVEVNALHNRAIRCNRNRSSHRAKIRAQPEYQFSPPDPFSVVMKGCGHANFMWSPLFGNCSAESARLPTYPHMDTADIAMAAGGVGLGAAISLLLVEVSRFRQAMDQACLLVMNLDEVPFNARNELDLQFGYIAHFKAVTLQLAIMDQVDAKRIIDRIVNECGKRARDTWTEIQTLPATDPQIITFGNDRWKIIQAHCAFFHNEQHVELIEELRACGPDWDAIFLAATRSLGMTPRRKTQEKVI